MKDSPRFDPEGEPPASGGSGWLLGILLIVAAAALLLLQGRRPAAQLSDNPLVGLPLPPLEVAGWLNTDKPLTADDLRGKFVLVDFWATWCGYCTANMPEVVKFRQHFRNQGVLVVGFTPEGGGELSTIKDYMKTVPGMDWPVAYGASFTIQMIQIPGYPTYVLYDRSGRSVWADHDFTGLEEATLAALAKE